MTNSSLFDEMTFYSQFTRDLLGCRSGLLGSFNHMVVSFGDMLVGSFHVCMSGCVVVGADALGSFFV